MEEPMFDKKFEDRIPHLRVKVKYLGAEIGIVKADEKRYFRRASKLQLEPTESDASSPETHAAERWRRRAETLSWLLRTGQSLRDHRYQVVKTAARHALLALGFLRGLDYARIESRTKDEPDFAEVGKLVERFGVQKPAYLWGKDVEAFAAAKADQASRFAAWTTAAGDHIAAQLEEPAPATAEAVT
jgi:hypothetical protein